MTTLSTTSPTFPDSPLGKVRGGRTRGNWRETALAVLRRAGLQDIQPQLLIPPDVYTPPCLDLGAKICLRSTQSTSTEYQQEVRREATTRLLEGVRRDNGDTSIRAFGAGNLFPPVPVALV